MGENESQSIDALGLKSFGDATKIAVEKSLDGAGAFLGRICLPVAEEVGLFLKDRVHIWRSTNVRKALEKAERKYEQIYGEESREVHPRILSTIVENASWADEDEVQEMWAGLLASSCSEDGKDDSNLIFINVLSQLSSVQIKILNFACGAAEKTITGAGWVLCEDLIIGIEDLKGLAQTNNIHRLDRELDSLRNLGLITGGFSTESTNADLTPTPLALHLFMRCQGSLEDPAVYFRPA